MSKKMTEDSPIEYSFKNKGPAKTQAPSSSVSSIGAEFHRCRRSWSRGDHDRRRDLQGKSKLELGVLQQDPAMLKSALYFNRNGVLDWNFSRV